MKKIMKKIKPKSNPKRKLKIGIKRKQSISTKTNYKPILHTRDLPATQGMLELTEKKIMKEMSSQFKNVEAHFKKIDSRFEAIDSRFEAIDSRFEAIDSRFEAIDSRFEAIDSRFEAIDSRFLSLEAKMDKIYSEIHRLAILMEEQNSRNKFVLDGYASLHDRIERLEKKDLENN